jgi:hypothetical protein
MTAPDFAVKGPGGRWYELPDSIVDGGFRGMSVTTVLSNGVPAPALKKWGENQVAEWAVANLAEWIDLPRDEALKALKNAPYSTLTKAGNRGTDIHEIAERVVGGLDVDSFEGQVHGKFAQYIRNFLDDFKVEVISFERTVINFEYLYAGSYDLLCKIDGRTVLVDWKTSKSVYGKFGVQLAAYAKADLELTEDDVLVPMPQVDELAVVHLTEDGYKFIPVVTPIDDLFNLFTKIRSVADFTVAGERKILGKAINVNRK